MKRLKINERDVKKKRIEKKNEKVKKNKLKERKIKTNKRWYQEEENKCVLVKGENVKTPCYR